MPLTLYWFPISQPSRAVHWYLLLNEIPFDSVLVDLTKGEQMKPEFLALNPLHTIPVIKDTDGTVVYESTAIFYYLREKYGDKVCNCLYFC